MPPLKFSSLAHCGPRTMIPMARCLSSRKRGNWKTWNEMGRGGRVPRAYWSRSEKSVPPWPTLITVMKAFSPVLTCSLFSPVFFFFKHNLCYLFIYVYTIVACGMLVPQLGTEPVFPAVEAKVLIMGPPGKSLQLYWNKLMYDIM